MQKWTQEESIAFECARECIVELMAVCSAKINGLESQSQRDSNAIDLIRQRRSQLASELSSLRLQDAQQVSWVRREYGQQVRDHRARSTTTLVR